MRIMQQLKVAAAASALALSMAACGDAGDDGSEGVEVDVAENAGDEFDDGTRMKELADAGSVIIGVKFDQPGIGFKGATDDMPVGFDPEMIKEVLDVMVDLAKPAQGDPMTMIVVTHEMGFARTAADRVLFMADGQIVEENTPEEFFTNPRSDRAKDFLGKILKH